MSKLEVEDVREAFKKLEELQKKINYYKGLSESIPPDKTVDGDDEDTLKDKKDDENN
jgi:hypothetical protein